MIAERYFRERYLLSTIWDSTGAPVWEDIDVFAATPVRPRHAKTAGIDSCIHVANTLVTAVGPCEFEKQDGRSGVLRVFEYSGAKP